MEEKQRVAMPRIGEAAPAFTAVNTQGNINFPSDYQGKWVILFSHPADFTPVCTSEIMELAAAQEEFEKLGTKIVVVSADKLVNHLEWKKSMESFRYKDRNPVKIDFPLVSDPDLVIAREYGMIHPNSSSTKDVRGVFIIDPKNKIRAIFFYPMSIGRNLGEIERTLTALQTADQEHVLIPANWIPGEDVLVPNIKSTSDAGDVVKPNDPDFTKPTWYMIFKKGK